MKYTFFYSMNEIVYVKLFKIVIYRLIQEVYEFLRNT
ncbi:hypothetical protein MCETHM1_00923 [Flavobacteriaceae bacterium]